MSDHSWDDHDDHDDQDPDAAGALDYLGDTGSVDDADPDDSGLDQLVTSDDEAHREEPDDADSYAAAMEPPATAAPDDEAPQDDEPRRVAVFAVTDPAGRVTAEASISGSIQRIKLSPGATAVTEAELTRSILSTAKLANMKGRAIQRSLIEGVLLSEGLDEERVEAIIEANASDLPTPRQADDAVAEAEAAYLRGQH
ncbi:hypothetical protein FZI85_28095 [Mycobacterium sp. CBMA293]|uniref:hypothetical protein n=1 Tax=unclassified Mycolicibacterium TaxID=2636767 RepID=UPI0012DE7F62|nr:MULTISPECIES: hypothetical protein [unclassified Mycolicibacterium]MUL45702.1 hypothetical protein [Mycolicibacterium sp. CBMA 360]MUL60373.1 hypothetical protein [Mycolicibacterium sp. CBMA 335]MUL71415.1 hypothetical protein [Mycolicibacterium sp. CBMA 311]MUL73160.1 hypothetical protein [Mycolicibacterium sp. CBMA 311]MUL97031.1 hypothetical protein [Mycolicibacterium sp. CBMA 230]